MAFSGMTFIYICETRAVFMLEGSLLFFSWEIKSSDLREKNCRHAESHLCSFPVLISHFLLAATFSLISSFLCLFFLSFLLLFCFNLYFPLPLMYFSSISAPFLLSSLMSWGVFLLSAALSLSTRLQRWYRKTKKRHGCVIISSPPPLSPSHPSFFFPSGFSEVKIPLLSGCCLLCCRETTQESKQERALKRPLRTEQILPQNRRNNIKKREKRRDNEHACIFFFFLTK